MGEDNSIGGIDVKWLCFSTGAGSSSGIPAMTNSNIAQQLFFDVIFFEDIADEAVVLLVMEASLIITGCNPCTR